MGWWTGTGRRGLAMVSRTRWGEVMMSNKVLLAEGQADPARPAQDRESGLDHVRQAVQGIRFGEVRVIIQDGVIVQIERVEKHRLR